VTIAVDARILSKYTEQQLIIEKHTGARAGIINKWEKRRLLWVDRAADAHIRWRRAAAGDNSVSLYAKRIAGPRARAIAPADKTIKDQRPIKTICIRSLSLSHCV
jgi:hypothetical protein